MKRNLIYNEACVDLKDLADQTPPPHPTPSKIQTDLHIVSYWSYGILL